MDHSTVADQANSKPRGEWAIESECGRLQEVLLGPPDHFKWLPTSAISRATLASGERFDSALAKRQHSEFVSVLEGADVACHFLEPDPALPYQVFSRDSSLMTPFGTVLVQPKQDWRRGEQVAASAFYEAQGTPIWRRVTAGPLEGGDFMFVEPGKALIGVSEERTTYEAAEQLSGWLLDEGIEVRIEPIPARYVHMDVLVCMLAPGAAVVCGDPISSGLIRWLREAGIELIEAGSDEAMGLGVNVLSLGDDKVLSGAGEGELNDRIRALGFEVLDPDLDSFTRGGGGAHCLTQPLARDTA